MNSNYNKNPEVKIKGKDAGCFAGWDDIITRLNLTISGNPKAKKVIVIEYYQGINDVEIFDSVIKKLKCDAVFDASEAMLPEDEIRNITFPDLTDDRIFGFMTRLSMNDFYKPEKVDALRSEILAIEKGTILIYGTGATIAFPDFDLLIYADMARWEIQKRMRRNEVSNLGITNYDDSFESQYKRAYFVDWRVCDRLKKEVMNRWDFILDTNLVEKPVMITAEAFSEGMKQAVKQPFSVVPYFDAGPWGGQWMKETFDLDKNSENYAWCFNCVPEENSLFLKFGENRFETPSINLVFSKPAELLGKPVYGRFGDEFPIRFDFLDTIGGGNLSLQVHPLTEYIQEKFGVNYTQDESYYILEAEKEASVYLGLRESVDSAKMITDLKEAQDNNIEFDASTFIQNWPAKKHDHFLIPGGTIHCSAKGCMVLEISATPYIFTFKLWDWGRLGMDGTPRPINIEHGIQNIQWNRTENWVNDNLVNRIDELGKGDGWREEKTGLHELEFIETRRHWFTKTVLHNTDDGVNVIALVEGREAIVESPTESFDSFIVHFAETFIVPAAVGEYTIRPYGESLGKECATVKAYVRVNG